MANKFALGRPQSRLVLLLILLTGVLSVIGTWFYVSRPRPEPGCADLINDSNGTTAISLPPGWELRDTVPRDDRVQYLDSERKRRGLLFEKWIVVDGPTGTSPLGLPLEGDPRWLPSYVPRTYQFRRTVVVLPYGPAVLKSSPVEGEVCVMPERKYTSLISGQCDGKFSVWK